MRVQEVMSRGVECVAPGATVLEAARKMRDFDVGPLPVCGEDQRLKGMITDRDIVVRAIAEGRDPATTRVEEVMTPDVIYCFEDVDVAEAARRMSQWQVRRLVVLDHDKKLVGIVSIGDLAVSTGDNEMAGQTLNEVSS